MLSTELGPSGGYLADAAADEGAAPAGRRIVMLYADPDTQANLTAWADAMGFDVGGSNPHEGHAFHITLLATVNDVAIPLADGLIEPVEVVPIGIAHLGRDEDVPAFVLAQIEGDYRLEAMRAHFVETYGAEPTFDFKPHISLSYDWDGEPDLRDRDLPDFPLVFDRLVVQAFDDDGGKAASPPAAKRVTQDQKWWLLLLTLGGVGLAVYAAVRLTAGLVGRIIDFFRGEEAVLLDQIAEKERELEAADGSGSAAGDIEYERIEGELEELREQLAEVQGAIDDVEAEPVDDDTEPERLAALIRELEGKAEGDQESRRSELMVSLDEAAGRIRGSEEYIDRLLARVRSGDWPPDQIEAFTLQGEVAEHMQELVEVQVEVEEALRLVDPSDGGLIAVANELYRRVTGALLDFDRIDEELAYYLGPTGTASAPTVAPGNGVW